MPAAPYNRLFDVLPNAGNVVVTVPWATVANTNEGAVQSGTATYTINLANLPVNDARLQAICDTLDGLARDGTAVVT